MAGEVSAYAAARGSKVVIDGVIRFSVHNHLSPLAAGVSPVVRALDIWRRLLFAKGLIGQDGVRYAGAAWGNLSARLDARAFLITGTQTGGLPVTDERHYTVVERCEWSTGSGAVHSVGPVAPSSEAMTHAALYAALPDVHFVFHVHSPALFHAPGLTATPPTVEYGTPAMADAVRKLALEHHTNLVVMRGHEDGVLSFAATAEEAGRALLSRL